jgi:hypothetical protein
VSSSSIHFLASDVISFFFITELCSIVYIYHIFFTHSLVCGNLGRYYSLARNNIQ